MTLNSSGDPHEPDLSFQHAALKVAWAEKNNNNFVTEVNKLIERYQQSSAVRHDQDTGRLAIHGGELPAWVPLAAGDIIFNLRSALDCCWMGMKRSVDRNAGKATLPRATTREGLVSTLKKASIEHVVAGSDGLLLDGIRPYREGRETLWLIAQVDNWNKHNMLVMTARETTSGSFHAEGEMLGGGQFNIVGINNKVVGGGSMGLGNFGQNATLRIHQANTAFDIILQSGKPAEEKNLIPFLRTALNDTKECIDLFVSRFGKQPS